MCIYCPTTSKVRGVQWRHEGGFVKLYIPVYHSDITQLCCQCIHRTPTCALPLLLSHFWFVAFLLFFRLRNDLTLRCLPRTWHHPRACICSWCGRDYFKIAQIFFFFKLDALPKNAFLKYPRTCGQGLSQLWNIYLTKFSSVPSVLFPRVRKPWDAELCAPICLQGSLLCTASRKTNCTEIRLILYPRTVERKKRESSPHRQNNDRLFENSDHIWPHRTLSPCMWFPQSNDAFWDWL